VLLGLFGRRIHPLDPPAAAVPGALYFPPTRHNLYGDFRAYWEANGGLDPFGYPLTEEFEERLEDGQVYRMQYFERTLRAAPWQCSTLRRAARPVWAAHPRRSRTLTRLWHVVPLQAT
jgi:hypothetical protein